MTVPSKITRAASNEEERKALEDSYRAAELYRERVLSLLRGRRKARRQEQDDDDYSSPCWAEKQAALNASVREINHLITLLGGTDGEERA